MVFSFRAPTLLRMYGRKRWLLSNLPWLIAAFSKEGTIPWDRPWNHFLLRKEPCPNSSKKIRNRPTCELSAASTDYAGPHRDWLRSSSLGTLILTRSRLPSRPKLPQQLVQLFCWKLFCNKFVRVKISLFLIIWITMKQQ